MSASTDSKLRFAVAPIADVDFRDAAATHDGSWTISGYASVFDQTTTLYDGDYRTVRESIAPGAFDAVLRSGPLVHLNVGHDMNRAVASTEVPAGEIGSLVLSADAVGLRFLARVDRADPDAQALAVKMSRGVARQASFAFTIGAEEKPVSRTLEDGRTEDTLRITQVRSLMDVCVTPQGAYPQTVATLRSIGQSIRVLPGDGPFGGGMLDPGPDPSPDALDVAEDAEPVETFASDRLEAIACLTDLLGEYPAELAALMAPPDPGEAPSTLAEEVGELIVALAISLTSPSQPVPGGSSTVTAYTRGDADRQRELAKLRARARSTLTLKEYAP